MADPSSLADLCGGEEHWPPILRIFTVTVRSNVGVSSQQICPFLKSVHDAAAGIHTQACARVPTAPLPGLSSHPSAATSVPACTGLVLQVLPWMDGGNRCVACGTANLGISLRLPGVLGSKGTPDPTAQLCGTKFQFPL